MNGTCQKCKRIMDDHTFFTNVMWIEDPDTPRTGKDAYIPPAARWIHTYNTLEEPQCP